MLHALQETAYEEEMADALYEEGSGFHLATGDLPLKVNADSHHRRPAATEPS